MKVQVVEEFRAGGKKLVVQVVYKVNGKTKKQNKEVFGLNEKRKAEALRSKLENSEKTDVVDQKITFQDALNSYIKVLEQGTLNTPEYVQMQIGYVKNHVAPYINQEYLSDYKMSDFKEFTLPKILSSKQLAWRTKDGKEYYIKLDKTIGKKTIKEVVGEFKKFVKYCLEHSWKIDYSIMTFKFQKNFFTQYIVKKEWLPQAHELLSVLNSEKDIKLKALYKLVSDRDPSYTLSSNTGSALMDEIKLHRRIELWGEGFGLLDMNVYLFATVALHLALWFWLRKSGRQQINTKLLILPAVYYKFILGEHLCVNSSSTVLILKHYQ